MDRALIRLLALVSAIVLVDTLFYSAIAPLLPGYRDSLGLTKGQSGMLAGAYAAGTLVASLPAGWLAARWGARPALLAGLALLAFACVAFGFGERYELLVAARALQGVGGAASWAAGLAWLLAVAPRDRRGQLIGIALGTAIAGAIGGPVLGAAAERIGTEAVFSAVAVVAAALAAAVVATPRPGRAPAHGRLAPALRDPRIRTGAWLTTLPALFFGTFQVLIPLRLDDLGASAAVVAGVFLAAAAGEALVSPLVGRVADRRGRLVPLRAGLAGVTAACVLLPLADAVWLLGAFAVGAAALAGTCWAPAMALLADGAESVGLAQAVAFGLVNLAWAGGQVAGAAGGAGLAGTTADAVPFAVLGGACVLTLVRLRRARAGAAGPA